MYIDKARKAKFSKVRNEVQSEKLPPFEPYNPSDDDELESSLPPESCAESPDPDQLAKSLPPGALADFAKFREEDRRQGRRDAPNTAVAKGFAEIPRARDDWPEPLNIFSRCAAPELPDNALPPFVHEMARYYAKQIGTNVGAAALAIVVACSGAIPRHVKVRGHQNNDGWLEPIILWGALVGEPSSKKSPLLRKVLRPLEDLDHGKRRASQLAQKDWDQRKKEKQKDLCERPSLEALVINNATLEALMHLQDTNTNGLFAFHDELAEWFASHDAYRQGKGMDRAYFLSCFNSGPKNVDRRTGSIHIEETGLPILGGIQPQRAAALMDDKVVDGLQARFCFAHMGEAALPSEEYNDLAERRYFDNFQWLVGLEPIQMQLDDAADERWRELQKEIKHRVSIFQEYEPRIAEFYGKCTGILLRLAGLYHLLDKFHGAIPLETLERAWTFLEDYITPNAYMFHEETLAAGNSFPRKVAGLIIDKKHHRLVPSDITAWIKVARKTDKFTLAKLVGPLEVSGWLRRDDGYSWKGWDVSQHLTFPSTLRTRSLSAMLT